MRMAAMIHSTDSTTLQIHPPARAQEGLSLLPKAGFSSTAAGMLSGTTLTTCYTALSLRTMVCGVRSSWPAQYTAQCTAFSFC